MELENNYKANFKVSFGKNAKPSIKLDMVVFMILNRYKQNILYIYGYIK